MNAADPVSAESAEVLASAKALEINVSAVAEARRKQWLNDNADSLSTAFPLTTRSDACSG
ncbi:MAG TPA: hypothetical protein DCL01_00765 [Thauera sp.]|nr:hypothetical protein [Thauera sp.]